MNSWTQFKTTRPLLLTLALLCIGLPPGAKAVVPPPDGGYPNFNTAEGQNALFSLTSGVGNTAVGWFSLRADTSGGFNTGVGAAALLANAASHGNTGVGAGALALNEGDFNTAVGAGALALNDTTGNTGVGAAALGTNTTGDGNTAVGATALRFNTTGAGNTAVGAEALLNNDGTFNTAVGVDALTENTTGSGNTAIGARGIFSAAALGSNTTGDRNTAIGQNAFKSNTTGSDNTAVGFGAGANVTTANNVICIGADVAGADVSNTTWIGKVYAVTTQSGTTAPVIVSDGGQLGTVASSERFKKDIATMEKASEAIMSLRPVTFHYKTDTKGTPQFGLIAEEVAKVNPALVLPDKDGQPYTVRYDAVNAMLLNEFLKEHRKNGEQEKTIAELKSGMTALTATVKEQASQIQKVSAQLEASKAAPQVAENNQ
jgi:hypothetical protein